MLQAATCFAMSLLGQNANARQSLGDIDWPALDTQASACTV
jgi:hypothetical protein